MNAPLNSLVRLGTEGILIAPNQIGTPPIVRGMNMGIVTLAPGLKQFTARISAGPIVDVTVGVRCIATAYIPAQWQTMIAGRVESPTGVVMTGNIPWHNVVTVNHFHDGYAWNLSWTDHDPNGWKTAGWTLDGWLSTLVEVPDTSRSRPPNPPIPALG